MIAAQRVAKAMRAAPPPHALFDERAAFDVSLAAFTARAFRRAVYPEELAARIDLYLEALSRGAGEAEASA